MSESRRCRLRLLDGSAQQTATSHHVLREQLPHDDADVGDVHLVDETVDRLLQRLPGQALEGGAEGGGGGRGDEDRQWGGGEGAMSQAESDSLYCLL